MLHCSSFGVLARHLDLSVPKDRALLENFARTYKPRDLWTSPDCTCFTYLQRINKARRHGEWRPAGEKLAIDTLNWCRRLHRQQQARGGRCHHEQSANSRAPFDGSLLRVVWASGLESLLFHRRNVAVGDLRRVPRHLEQSRRLLCGALRPDAAKTAVQGVARGNHERDAAQSTRTVPLRRGTRSRQDVGERQATADCKVPFLHVYPARNHIARINQGAAAVFEGSVEQFATPCCWGSLLRRCRYAHRRGSPDDLTAGSRWARGRCGPHKQRVIGT